jgi:flagellar basal-body rod modification protein FlgD
MSIEGIGASFGGSTIPADERSSQADLGALGMNQFLTLLLTQLKNQDPLNPLDSADFTAQLSQFAGVEQLYGMHAKLADIQETLSNREEQQDLIGLIGKTIKADDNTIHINDGELLSGSYRLEGHADVEITIYDSNGLKVRTLYLERRNEGEYTIDWDGKNDGGQIVENGVYTFQVNAKNEKGIFVPTSTYISGEVTGVTYEYGEPYLVIGERLVVADDNIVEVSKTE